MNKFSLLKILNEDVAKRTIASETVTRPKLTEGIKYEEYEIKMFDGKPKTVYVPYRRTEIFESEMISTDILTETTVRSILRKCNGVTEI